MDNKDALKKLGMSRHLNGYDYWNEALNLVREKPRLIHNMGLIYEQVGDKLATTAHKVEGAMRKAVECAYSRLRSDTAQWAFGEIIGKKLHPSNSEFLGVLYEIAIEDEHIPIRLSPRAIALLNNPKFQAWAEKIIEQ